MKTHPFSIVRGNLIPLLGVLAWISGGGLAHATSDLLVSNPSTSVTAFCRVAVKPESY